MAALGRLWRCFLRREVERRPAGALHEATVHERPALAVRPTYACIHTCQGSGATDADTTCCGTGASGRRCPRPNAWRESARRHSRRGRRRHPDGGGGALSRTPSGPRASLAQTRTPYARAEQGTQLHTGKPTRASVCTTNAWASRTRATVGELSHRERLYCAVTAFNRCSRTVVRAICTLRKHAQLCACFRAQDTTQGDTGVVEPGARAAGAKGIERCPPHVYP